MLRAAATSGGKRFIEAAPEVSADRREIAAASLVGTRNRQPGGCPKNMTPPAIDNDNLAKTAD
jgi:hypothetical protein